MNVLRNAAAVTLLVAGSLSASLAGVHHGVCNMDIAMEGSRNIRLSAPLGSRLLTDGTTGRSLHWFDVRKMLRPSDIPAGYKLQDVTPLVTGSLPAPGTPGCRQDYQSRDATL